VARSQHWRWCWRVGYIDQRRLHLDGCGPMNRQFLGNPSLWIPCPKISRPCQRRFRHCGQRSWSIGLRIGRSREKNAFVCCQSSSACAVRKRTDQPHLCSHCRVGRIEIYAKIRVTLGAENMRSAGVDSEHGLTKRGPVVPGPDKAIVGAGAASTACVFIKPLNKIIPLSVTGYRDSLPTFACSCAATWDSCMSCFSRSSSTAAASCVAAGWLRHRARSFRKPCCRAARTVVAECPSVRAPTVRAVLHRIMSPSSCSIFSATLSCALAE